MTTMSGTLSADHDTLFKVEKSRNYLPRYARKRAQVHSTSYRHSHAQWDLADPSKALLAFAEEENASPTKPPHSPACDSVVQAILECLGALAHREMRSLSVSYREGVITLRGEVPTFYIKQVAQESIRRIARNATIDNLVEVRRTEPKPCVGQSSHS